MKALARWIATLGPVGSAPLAPATAASAVVALVGWLLPVPPLPVTLALILAGCAVAVWSATEAEKVLGHDAKPIVIDEVIGQSLALLWAPHRPLVFVVAFVLFRVFDVWKPLGAREVQVLPAGWGILADDLIAGLTSCGVLQLALWGTARLGYDIL
jgi:phosphatidylglycerophosphatase A